MADRVKTGIDGLDDMLEGGFIPGRAILISGSAGTGKTSLCMQFIYNGIKNYDEPGVFITLEQSKEEIKNDMKKLGMDLDELGSKFNLIGGSVMEVMKSKEKTQARFEDFLLEIEDIIKQNNAKRVAIDSLNMFLILFNTDEERRKALVSLVELFSRRNCTALLTCEIRGNTLESSWYGFEEFVVDGVIVLYNKKRQSCFVQGLAIRKMRGIKHEKNIVPYEITDKGITVYPEEPWYDVKEEPKSE